MKGRSITERMEDLNHRGALVPVAVLTGIIPVILVLTSAACIFPNPERTPALATPQTDPVTLTPEVRRYADCALGNAHGAYGPAKVVGFNAHGQNLPQLQQPAAGAKRHTGNHPGGVPRAASRNRATQVLEIWENGREDRESRETMRILQAQEALGRLAIQGVQEL